MTTLPFVDPVTQEPLVEKDGALYSVSSGNRVADVINSIPRFVDMEANYSNSFGLQWNRWHNEMSDTRSGGTTRKELILRRTKFADYTTEGRTILECGMGGGDDTEILLQFPFSEVHSFDMSNSVDRANEYLDDPRLTISQASIFDIPYPDQSFDLVFCHRVLQHTPDPAEGLRSVCRKVKPGGVLFAHIYKDSKRYRRHYKYKYRWLSTRLSHQTVFNFVEKCGPFLWQLHQRARKRSKLIQEIAFRVIPFHRTWEYGDLKPDEVLELAKLCTFDALTPTYDLPMKKSEFCGIIEGEGFEIDNLHDPKTTPLWCTARRVRA